MSRSEALGTEPIGPLLRQQAVPAAIGMLILSIYGIVDTIFVGRWVGSLAIAAITVVLPITFLIASIGMAIGVGGASIISRALGSSDHAKANLTFGNQAGLTLILALSVVIAGGIWEDPILRLFGGKGDILEPARVYFLIMLYGVPFLAWAMMSNNVIRSEGKPKIAMTILIVPAVVNIILDPIFIVYLDMGLAGAAWATVISYAMSAAYALWFFLFGQSELKFELKNWILSLPIVREIFAIGGVTLARQGTISFLAVILNNALFSYGGEMSVSVWGIINRVMMFANFPVLGITQGFLPIAGYNYGAEQWERVRSVIKTAIFSGTVIALGLFAAIMLFAEQLVSIFTTEADLIRESGTSLRKVFLATPLLSIQLIASAYYQAIGRALPALLLSLTKQGIFLIPLLVALPPFFNLNGIWYAFPIADVLSAAVAFWYLRMAIKSLQPTPAAVLKSEPMVLESGD